MSVNECNNLRVLDGGSITLGSDSNDPKITGNSDAVVFDGKIRFENSLIGPEIHQEGDGALGSLNLSAAGNSLVINNSGVTIGDLYVETINGEPFDNPFDNNVSVTNYLEPATHSSGGFLVKTSESDDVGKLVFQGPTLNFNKTPNVTAGDNVRVFNSGYVPGSVVVGSKVTVQDFEGEYIVDSLNETGPFSSLIATLRGGLTPTLFPGEITNYSIAPGIDEITIVGINLNFSMITQSSIIKFVDQNDDELYYSINGISMNSSNMAVLALSNSQASVDVSGDISAYLVAPGVSKTVRFYNAPYMGMISNGSELTFGNYYDVNPSMSDIQNLSTINVKSVTAGTVTNNVNPFFSLLNSGSSNDITTNVVNLTLLDPVQIGNNQLALKITVNGEDFFIGLFKLNNPV